MLKGIRGVKAQLRSMLPQEPGSSLAPDNRSLNRCFPPLPRHVPAGLASVGDKTVTQTGSRLVRAGARGTHWRHVEFFGACSALAKAT